MERLTIDVGAVVQHYKRNAWWANATEKEREEEPFNFLYKIENVAYWADNTRGSGIMIVYRQLYGNGDLWVRTLEEFLCKTCVEDCGQGYRFVRYEGKIELPEF